MVAAGISMGGIISRYACAKAEADGNPLPISKLLTLDAPHQGATISPELQIWRKQKLDQNNPPDYFAEHASNNQAAMELLNFNAYDPSSAIRNSFFNDLYYTNGNGLPHNVKSIAVSFSTDSPNPHYSGENWLEVKKDNSFVKTFAFDGSQGELSSGSFLPRINIDGTFYSVPNYHGNPFPIFTAQFWSSAGLSLIRSFNNPWITITQYENKNPTFISHNSSLNIVNGVSPFTTSIIPAATGFHDVVPSSIIVPLVNALVEDEVYIQNKTYSSQRTVIANETIYAGSNVTTAQPAGNVNLNAGSEIIFKAGEEIALTNEFNVNHGADFTAVIATEMVSCDGNLAYQNRNAPPPKNNEEATKAQIDTTQFTYVFEPIVQEITEKAALFPTPATDKVFFTHLPEDAVYTYILSDVHGAIVSQGILNSTREINLTGLPLGMYIVSLSNQASKQLANFKIIKI